MSSPNRNILSDIFCIGCVFCAAFFAVKFPLTVREQCINSTVMALGHGLSGGTVASLHYRNPVKIIQFFSGNDQLGRIHVNRIVPFSVDLHLAGRRKVGSLNIIGMVRLRHNLNGIQCGIIDSHTHLGTLKRILSVVGILFSIEKVILQCFQICT